MAKRPIFEEVSSGSRGGPVLSAVGAIDKARGNRGGVRLWLVLLGLLVGAMILVGGMTRLTDSGLSITEWKPLTGALPPMTQADWEAEFRLYQAIPQFQLMNNQMTLDEFKSIYWWEWGHRQLGRFIGLVWAVGFLFFLLRKEIPPGWTGRLLFLGFLGGLQGAIGWWMVSSGLEGTALSVASTRLAVHLGLAFLILAYIAWDVMLLARSESDLMKARRAAEPNLAAWAGGLIALSFAQILLGALVAGIDAGRGYTDWPLMAGRFFPEHAFHMTPIWHNFTENAGLVQFMHRMAGYVVLAFAIWVWVRAGRSPHPATRSMARLAALLLIAQAAVGVATVMTSAPLHIAIFHQAGAILVWILVIRLRFLAKYPVEQGLRGGAR